jgi:4a-hydroxytetrahydrobiopterin dehydratase
MSELEHKHCLPCEGLGSAFDAVTVKKNLQDLKLDWQASSDYKIISKDFIFKNYYHTMAFVNAIAWMANLENHHPDLEVGYNHCKVHYMTHALKGLSENDFICAAKVEALYQPYEGKHYDRK